MLGVRGMAIGAALTFGAVTWWATRGTNPAAEGFAQVREEPASHANALTANTWSAPAVKDETAGAQLELGPLDDSQRASELSFQSYVDDKYRFLLESVGRSPQGSRGLRTALLERERIVVATNTARQGTDEVARSALPDYEARLAEVDRRIGQLLPAGEIVAFESLKDSHIEQFQLEDYAQGISQVAPLRDSDRRAILYSKVASRQRFRQVLDQSGLMHGDLTPAQRQAVLVQVTRALAEARDSFLQEARQQLTDDQQFSLLANYEQGEYSAEVEKLRGVARPALE